MENNAFKISYDGPALLSHEMNVKDLAPALLAVGDLLEDTNRILNGDKTTVSVNIKATNPGSVDVVLSVCQHLLAQATFLFSGDGVSTIVNADALLKILGFGGGGGGLVGLVFWLRNRKIKNITKVEIGNFKIETEDGDMKIVTENEIKLFGFLKIRKHLESIIKKPLEKEGVDAVSFGSDNKKNVIRKEDINSFSAPEVEQELIDESEVEMSLQIVNISFQEGGKWRFSDGNATFFAEIKDEDFTHKIYKNEEVFAKDDLLKVLMKRRQYLRDGGIGTDYEIIKVIEHRSAAIQIKLPFS